MVKCVACGTVSNTITAVLRLCRECIRHNVPACASVIRSAHGRSRTEFGLPESPPRDPCGTVCRLCANECSLTDGAFGYCGVRWNERGRLGGTSPTSAHLSWYYDPLPTNCVASWVCPAGTGAGYPEYSYRIGPEYGYQNIAVFFHSCPMNCLYCHNWQFRKERDLTQRTSINRIVRTVNARTACVCYFGGDPTPQLPFALKASKEMIKRAGDRIFRICWETNGMMHRQLLDKMIKLSLQTGGVVKFDLKAWDENLHRALTGVSNKRILENFAYAAGKIRERPNPPLLVASTLLVPGYIDEEEVRNIARFIASFDPSIPYSLLAFHPQFLMHDVPPTSKGFAYRAYHTAREEGLLQVKVGNTHILL